ncbi:MAG: B12-binding domain-containing radical SAM protein [Sulfobacillus sp.]
MKIVALVSPGRFPTVVGDPGMWWSRVASPGKHAMLRWSANESWWQVLCNPEVSDILLSKYSPAQRLRRRLEWAAHGIDLRRSARSAGKALNRLCTYDVYRSASAYIETVSFLSDHLKWLNQAQQDLVFSVEYGVRVAGLDYNSSGDLARYANRKTVLSALIAKALENGPDEIGLLVMSVTSPEDLLTTMIAAIGLRNGRPGMHVCLADHGYENFSLHAHLSRLKTAGTLDRIFDTIIVSKDERDRILPKLVDRFCRGNTLTGYLTEEDLPDAILPEGEPALPPPPVPTFSPEPIFWTRLSDRRCYWSRCTFCVQNIKYDNPSPPSLREVTGAVDRIEALVEAGYRTFIFSDEALSPAFLASFCHEVGMRRLNFKWACRCKMELAHTRELLQKMRASGCFEILFGLESISPRMQKKMDKFVEGLDGQFVKRLFHAMNELGIGLHVNLIAGFPGDTPREATDTVEFVIDALSKIKGATFLLNRFELFPETPIMDDPCAFGVIPLVGAGDMTSSYPYTVVPEYYADALAVDRMIPGLRERLLTGLGWRTFGACHRADTALSLYFGSGHGAVFKTLDRNVFANPLMPDP